MKNKFQSVVYNIVLLSCVAAIVACNSDRRKRQLDSNCNASFTEYERRKAPEKLKQESKSLAGNVTSYTVGAGVILTETLLYIGGGVVIGALICSPILAVEAAAESDSGVGIECVIRVGSQAASIIIQENEYSLSKKFWESTESIRIKSYDQLVVHLLDSVECRTRSGKPRDIQIARKQLKALKKDKNIMNNIESFTRRRIDFLSESLNHIEQH